MSSVLPVSLEAGSQRLLPFFESKGFKKIMKNFFSIAIDGPVGAGKGTLAVSLSKKLGALYINTGAMYRALALACLKSGVNIDNEKEVEEIFKKNQIELKLDNMSSKVFLNGENVSAEIFTPKISKAVAPVSRYAQIRKEMVKRQKDIMKERSVVIEGRDIATEVIPNADLKIFLTADLEVRARRRYNQLLKKGIETTIEEVLKDTQERDRMDTEREASPLTIVEDAYALDTTNMTIDETVEKVMEKLREKNIA